MLEGALIVSHDWLLQNLCLVFQYSPLRAPQTPSNKVNFANQVQLGGKSLGDQTINFKPPAGMNTEGALEKPGRVYYAKNQMF